MKQYDRNGLHVEKPLKNVTSQSRSFDITQKIIPNWNLTFSFYGLYEKIICS